eukprot:TRINITY_DN41855_c0_g2_i1.p1 TRINITY_DN41855_c0_g2~~TRINITY_DN41855_c0_g2_i1.p1  ORF type:complete len:465 (-),score=94.22 TRINITY_DN41855_c0_g2_i1:531-1925(-)
MAKVYLIQDPLSMKSLEAAELLRQQQQKNVAAAAPGACPPVFLGGRRHVSTGAAAAWRSPAPSLGATAEQANDAGLGDIKVAVAKLLLGGSVVDSSSAAEDCDATTSEGSSVEVPTHGPSTASWLSSPRSRSVRSASCTSLFDENNSTPIPALTAAAHFFTPAKAVEDLADDLFQGPRPLEEETHASVPMRQVAYVIPSTRLLIATLSDAGRVRSEEGSPSGPKARIAYVQSDRIHRSNLQMLVQEWSPAVQQSVLDWCFNDHSGAAQSADESEEEEEAEEEKGQAVDGNQQAHPQKAIHPEEQLAYTVHKAPPTTSFAACTFPPQQQQHELLAEMLCKGYTTVMVANLPAWLSQSIFLSELNTCGFKELYDFAYLPCNLKTHKGSGYAFVNFVSDAALTKFVKFWWKSRHFCTCASDASIKLTAAHVQGRRANEASTSRTFKLRNASLRPWVQRSPQVGCRSP